MTTTTDEAAQAVPVLGEITVTRHDGAECVTWSLGTSAVSFGLTPHGIAAGAIATGKFLDGLSQAKQAKLRRAAGLLQVRIAVHHWSVPLLPELAPDIEQMMTDVINTAGVIGKVELWHSY